jgi:GNAT superfamily N-acetyltransferase
MTSVEAPPRSAVQTSVRVLQPEDLADALAVLGRGFAEDPASVALIPEADVRARVWGVQLRTTLASALPHGSVHGAMVGEALGGVAVWHPPGVPRGSIGDSARMVAGLLPLGPAMLRALPHAAATAVVELRPMIALARPRSQAITAASRGPTYHLAFLATAPEHRGKGLARLLLDRQLARCDEDGLAAWLETTDPANPPIYERFGFQTVLHVADAGWMPGFWVMRREPRP